MTGATITPTGNACFVQTADRSQPRRRCSARLERALRIVRQRRDADHRVHEPFRRERREQIDVTLDHRALGDDRERMSILRQHFDDAARDAVLALDRLIRIGVRADRDRRAAVARSRQLLLEQTRGVLLVEEPRLEIQTGRKIQVGVRRRALACDTPVLAAAWGLIDWSNEMSGEVLREMIERAGSGCTIVASGGGSSSRLPHPSSMTSARVDSKRPAGLETAPRPVRVAGRVGNVMSRCYWI